jgi:hypothetical protein
VICTIDLAIEHPELKCTDIKSVLSIMYDDYRGISLLGGTTLPVLHNEESPAWASGRAMSVSQVNTSF